MNVLSLFDGMSCCRLALNKIGIYPDKYYASEIDKFAIKVTQANFPDTIQLGSVTDWRNWKIDFSKVDLLTAGFPCQAWSVAGKQEGDKDPRGALVHTLIEIWSEIKKHNPDVKFLFENVKMKKEFLDYIDNLFGVKHFELNSGKVSAQNRVRVYWHNFGEITQPKDRNIKVIDLLAWSKSTRYPKDGSKVVVHRARLDGKGNTLATGEQCGSFSSKNYILDKVVAPCNPSPSREGIIFLGGVESSLRLNNGKFYSRNFREGGRIYSVQGKAGTLTAQSKGGLGGYSGLYGDLHGKDLYFRTLTPEECEELQGVPIGHTKIVSNTQRYKMVGNGWQVDTIAYILSQSDLIFDAL